jgi:hypothetical protein
MKLCVYIHFVYSLSKFFHLYTDENKDLTTFICTTECGVISGKPESHILFGTFQKHLLVQSRPSICLQDLPYHNKIQFGLSKVKIMLGCCGVV